MKSGFDRLAAPYRWMEYLSFGRALQDCRLRFLPDLNETRSALLLGDGDGRFAAKLLRAAPGARVIAIDGSPAMLQALNRRCHGAGVHDRVTSFCADLTNGVEWLQGQSFDLVTTHFFLDCLTEAETSLLISRIKPLLRPDARWIVSEFHIPKGAMRLPARLLVWGLYAAFGLLTGLRVRHLPDHAAAFHRRGFLRVRHATSLGGLLLSETWVMRDS